MELRPSGKIAIGIIAALGTIGALHLFIFKDNAQQYQEAKANYEATLSSYNQQGTTPPLEEIYRFRYITLRERLRFWETLQQLRIALPAVYAPDSGVDYRQHHIDAIWNTLADLQQRLGEGAQGNGPRLTFLGQGRTGWNLTDSLPQALIERNIAVEDEIRNLRNEDRLLNSLDPKSRAYAQRAQNYDQLLRRLGLDPAIRRFIDENMGDVPALMYTFNRIKLVRDRLPAEFFAANEREPNQQLNVLYNLFRVEWPKNQKDEESLFLVQRQLEALMDIVRVAKEEQIEEISYVKFHPMRDICYKDFSAEAAATPTPAMGSMDMYGMDPAMMDPAMMGMAGGGRFGMDAAAAAAAACDNVGTAIPLEIRVTGSNAAVASFLYRIGHSRNPLELDRLRVISSATNDGKVTAQVFVNTVGFANFTLEMKQGGVFTEADIDQNITQTKREIAELASKAGARDLAIRDGVLLPNGQLAQPTPAP